MLLTLADHIPLLIRMLPEEVRSTAHEIGCYFNNRDCIALEIRGLFKHTLRPMLEQQDKVLLIGHSLGSVIAYDTLWELTHEEGLTGKLGFLTLDSPMGLHYIQRRLLGMNHGGERSYPALIRRWVNFSAKGDVTALNQKFSDSFRTMCWNRAWSRLSATIAASSTTSSAAMRD